MRSLLCCPVVPHSPHLHSFPTRRSSDLLKVARDGAAENKAAQDYSAVYASDYEADDAAEKDVVGYVHSYEVGSTVRSEEHTSELQSLRHLVCRLLLEKNKSMRTT